MASAHLDARHFCFFLYTTGAFQVATWPWNSEGVSLSKSVCGLFKRNWLGELKFLPRIESLLAFVARSFEDLSSWHWYPGSGTWCGSGNSHSRDILPELLFTCEWKAIPFHVCTPPTTLDRCGFFNSIVVRLPFTSISDGSEWWLFYILVVILMWLYEEASYVCPHRHLTRSPRIKLLYKTFMKNSIYWILMEG